MVYDINFTATNNVQVSKACYAISGTYLYSNMSIGVVEYDFAYDLGQFLCGGDGFDEMKI